MSATCCSDSVAAGASAGDGVAAAGGGDHHAAGPAAGEGQDRAESDSGRPEGARQSLCRARWVL